MRGRTGRERRRINQKMEMKWRTGRKIRKKKGRRMRRVRRGLRMMGISNVDETNLPELLHLHTGGTSAQAQVVAGGTVHVCEDMRGGGGPEGHQVEGPALLLRASSAWDTSVVGSMSTAVEG